MMIKLGELAELVGGRLKGNAELSITGFCSLDNPSPSGISFLEKGKDIAKLSDIMLGALVCAETHAQYFPDVIITDNPKLAFIKIMHRFMALAEKAPPPPGIHPTAVVDEGARIADTARVEACAVIGPDVRIGERTLVGAGAVIGAHVTIGDDTKVLSNVTIHHHCTIGNHVEIHSGSVIGAEGFGFVPTADGHLKFPQVGDVLIEDYVEIGANCCVDRAALDTTVIHAGTKLDNLVQVAHGVRIGHHTVIAAQTGISGSTRVGNWCIVGGQAGFQGHITVGDQSIIAAQSGVFSDLPFKSKVSGYPAKPHGQSLKVLALTFKLPELVEKVKSLEIELDLMRGELKGKAKREHAREREREREQKKFPEGKA